MFQIILIFGICGALRCDEAKNMKVYDVEDLGDRLLISVRENINDFPGQFMIGNLFYSKVKAYMDLRPPDQFSDSCFINYQKDKCTRQPIGKHKIGEVPSEIDSFLSFKDVKKYTGHCFRGTAATLLSESGAGIQFIKQMGNWRSDMIAQDYIDNSMLNKEIYSIV